MHAAVQEGAQFIVATHSPIVLAYPGAHIVSFDHAPPTPVSFDTLDHVRLTRDVLADPAGWMRRILTPSDP
jgi:predicted ATPase